MVDSLKPANPRIKSGVFLALLAATSLLACSKPEEAPVPVAPPYAVAPQTEPAPVASIVETPPAPPPAPPPTVQLPAAVAMPKLAAAAKSAPVSQPSSEAAPNQSLPNLAHGQQVYRQSCAFCHDKGLMGAPKIGDAAAWSPRLAQGMDALYASALRGKGAMPGKGGNPSLADDDVKSAVNYLIAEVR